MNRNSHHLRFGFPQATGWVLGIVVILSAAGCKSEPEEPPTYPVSGEVFYKGKPAAKAKIIFRPQDGSTIGPWPHATVDETGHYQLTFRRLNDGAKEGEYAVIITLRHGQNDGDVGPNILPAKYARAETTPIKITIKPGDNVISRINLEP